MRLCLVLPSLTLQGHGFKSRVYRNLFRGGEFHPLIGLAIDTSRAVSHDSV